MNALNVKPCPSYRYHWAWKERHNNP